MTSQYGNSGQTRPDPGFLWKLRRRAKNADSSVHLFANVAAPFCAECWLGLAGWVVL